MERKEMEKFGQRISALREERGETQQELADAIGITRQSLSRYEIAARTINVDVLGELAKHFNVSSDYLLGLSDVRSTEQDIKIACEVTGLSENVVHELQNSLTISERRLLLLTECIKLEREECEVNRK